MIEKLAKNLVNLKKEFVSLYEGDSQIQEVIPISKSELFRISNIAQTGLAKVISPVHTVQDGDMVISVCLGDLREDVNLIGVIAAELTQKAIIRAVEQSGSLGGIPCSKELIANKVT